MYIHRRPYNYYHINEAVKTDPETKDYKRINDMLAKAGTNHVQLMTLANKMANAITQKDKAERRYKAALEICGSSSVITNVFLNRCQELGCQLDTDEVSNNIVNNQPSEEEIVADNTATDDFDYNSDSNDNTPVKIETEDISQKAIEKAIDEYNTVTDDDINIATDMGLLKNTPLQYASEIVRIHKIIGKKLDEYNLEEIINNICKNIKLKYNKEISSISNFNFDPNTCVATFDISFGSFVINSNFTMRTEQVRSVSYFSGTSYVKRTYKIVGDVQIRNMSVSLADFSIVFGSNQSKNPQTAIGWDEKSIVMIDADGDRYPNKCYHISPVYIACPKYLNYIQLIVDQIKESLQKIPDIKKLLTVYTTFIHNKTITKLSKDFITNTNTQDKLYSRLTMAICDKFDVDNEPENDNWPGFKIKINLQEHAIMFTHYSMGIHRHYNKTRSNSKAKHFITNLTQEQEHKILYKWLCSIFGKQNVVNYPDTYIFSVDFDVFKQKMDI